MDGAEGWLCGNLVACAETAKCIVRNRPAVFSARDRGGQYHLGSRRSPR